MTMRTIAAIAVACLITGLLFAQNRSSPDYESDDSFEWQLFGTEYVAASDWTVADGPVDTVVGFTFLLNRRTGKVYRFFPNCEEFGEFGCFDDMPVLDGIMTSRLPSPQSIEGLLPRR